MYKAVGWNSQNEYRIGNTLADARILKIRTAAHK